MNIHFQGFLNPEEIEKQRKDELQRMTDEKLCVVCKNTYLINDQITMCVFSNKCVNDNNGQNCEHWESLI